MFVFCDSIKFKAIKYIHQKKKRKKKLKKKQFPSWGVNSHFN